MTGRIFIQIQPGVEAFTTGVEYGDHKQHAANAPEGARTFYSILPEEVTRLDVMADYENLLAAGSSGWRHWAARCMYKYDDVFFVEEHRHPHRMPAQLVDMAHLRQRIMNMPALNGGATAAVIRNNLRRFGGVAVTAAIQQLIDLGSIRREGNAFYANTDKRSMSALIRDSLLLGPLTLEQIWYATGAGQLESLSAFQYHVKEEVNAGSIVFDGKRYFLGPTLRELITAKLKEAGGVPIDIADLEALSKALNSELIAMRNDGDVIIYRGKVVDTDLLVRKALEFSAGRSLTAVELVEYYVVDRIEATDKHVSRAKKTLDQMVAEGRAGTDTEGVYWYVF